LDPDGDVARDVFVLAEGADLGGRVGGDARVYGRWVEVPGRVEKDLRFSGERLLVGTTGYVGGDVKAKVRDEQAVKIAAKNETMGRGVQGAVDISERSPDVTTSRFVKPSFYVWQLVRLVAACLTGVVLFWLLPGLFESKRETAVSLLRNGGVGFVTLVAIPIAAVLLGITLIGLPLALLGLMAWLAVMYLASVFVAAWIGRSVLRPRSGNGSAFLFTLLLGLAILRVAVNLPWVGGLVGFVALVVGMGMAVSQATRVVRHARAS
jgi:hypothetical protein